MLDIRFIREHPDLVQAGARKKRIDIDIHHLLELDERRRSLISQVESLKALRNKMSKEIPDAPGCGAPGSHYADAAGGGREPGLRRSSA